jgi:hypothetical protein
MNRPKIGENMRRTTLSLSLLAMPALAVPALAQSPAFNSDWRQTVQSLGVGQSTAFNESYKKSNDLQDAGKYTEAEVWAIRLEKRNAAKNQLAI